MCLVPLKKQVIVPSVPTGHVGMLLLPHEVLEHVTLWLFLSLMCTSTRISEAYLASKPKPA